MPGVAHPRKAREGDPGDGLRDCERRQLAQAERHRVVGELCRAEGSSDGEVVDVLAHERHPTLHEVVAPGVQDVDGRRAAVGRRFDMPTGM